MAIEHYINVKSRDTDRPNVQRFKDVRVQQLDYIIPFVSDPIEIDCGAGGTAQETNVIILPADCILLDVVALCTEAFDGATTKTFELGITGNTDKYLDPGDVGVTLNDQSTMSGGTSNDQKAPEYIAANAQLIATWTNVTGAAAGKIKLWILFTPITAVV